MDDIEMVDEAYKIVCHERREYLGSRFKRWIVLGFGVILGVGLAYCTT
jgi:hypothetical protein